MKAITHKSIPLLVLLLLGLVIPSTFAQRKFSIGFLLDKQVRKDAEDKDLFKKEVQGVVGDKASIRIDSSNVLYNNYDHIKAEQNLQKLLNNRDVDLIISFGPLNNFVLNKQSNFTKPVIIYGQIDTDFSQVPDEGRVTGIKNLNYVVVPQSIEQDVIEFHDVHDFSTLGILIDRKIYNFLPNLKNLLDLKLQQFPFNYKILPYDTIEQLDAELESVDAVFISIGLYQDQSEYEAISELFIRHKLPSFSTIGEITTDNGFLFSKGNEATAGRIMRRLALNIEDIVDGIPAEKIPIYMNDDRQIYYNLETAIRIDFEPKASSVENFVLVGDLRDIKKGKHYRLSDIFRQVLEENLNLQAEQKNVELAEKNTKLAKSNYLPQVSASTTLSQTDNPSVIGLLNNKKLSNSITGQVDQVVYSQEISSAIKIAKWTERATKYDYNTTLLNQLADASNSFFSALVARTNYFIEFENFELTRQNYTIAKQNYESGQTGKADVLRWKSEMATCSQRLISFYATQRNAMDDLNQQLSNPVGMPIHLVSPKTADELEQANEYQKLLRDVDDPKRKRELLRLITEVAVRRAPEIQSLVSNQNAVLEQVKQYQRSRYIPTVSFRGQYDYRTFPDVTGIDDGYYTLSLNLSYPIYQGGQRILNRNIASVQADQLRINKQNIETQIRQSVAATFNTLVSDMSNIHYSTQSVDASRESLKLMQIAYESGAVNITSLIDAQSTYITARSNNETALFNFLSTSLQVERLVGYFFDLNDEESNKNFMQELEQTIDNAVKQN